MADPRANCDPEPVDVVVRVAVSADVESVEAAAGALWAEGASAVQILEGPDGATLVAGFPTPAAAREVASVLADRFGARAEPVHDLTWRDAWKSFAAPVEIGDSLVIVPPPGPPGAVPASPRRPVPLPVGRREIRIDPGPCFGSGTHPSTRLILRWLEADPPVTRDVLDVGCGSGILSVACAVLGASRVTALDVDPEAVRVTRHNARANGVAAVVSASSTALTDLADGTADLILINVTAGVHAGIGPAASTKLRLGGRLVVAGLLPGQWRHVAGAYGSLRLERRLDLDGWEGAQLRADR